MVAKEREEYEKRHLILREEKPKVKESPSTSDMLEFNNLGPDQNKLPMTLSRQEANIKIA